MSRLILRNTPAPIQSQLGGIRLQTSVWGQPIPIIYGRNRLAGNLLWYGDFIAKPISGKNKGSKKGNVTYDYGAAVAIGLCRGQVAGLGGVWDTQGTLPVNDTTETYTISGGSPSYTTTQQPTFIQDLGVTESTPYSVSANDYGSPGPVTLTGTQQTPMTKVSGSPASGQYSESGGTYQFSSADVGVLASINYSYGPPNTLGVSDPIQSLNLTFFDGAQGQAPWSYLTSKHPSQAIGYSTVAYVATPLMDLGTGGMLPNLTFEIYGLLPFGHGLYDSNPRDVIYDATTNALYGGGFPTSGWGDLSLYSNFCVAMGLLISPVFDSQRALGDWLNDILDGTNSTIIRNGFTLQIIPYGDTTAVGNGATFTPPTNPQFDLGFDDLISEKGKLPITIERPSIQDAYNSVRVEYLDRGNSYNPEPAEAQDLRAVELYKLRPEAPRSYHFFTEQAPAALSCQMALNRLVAIRNKYRFTLGQRYIPLNPMDLVTLPKGAMFGTTDTTKVPVRITSIQEKENSNLDFEAEDFPWGTAGPTLYARQSGSSGFVNANVDPGPIGAVAIVEALPRMRGTDPNMELWIGVCGGGVLDGSFDITTWGGCRIWLSTDGGTEYDPMGVLPVNSNMGYVYSFSGSSPTSFPTGSDPDSTNTLGVVLVPGVSIASVQQAAQNNLQSLMAVFKNAGAVGTYQYEVMAYGASEDVSYRPFGTNAPFYELWNFGAAVASGQYLRRGLIGSPISSHPNGAPVLFLDGNIFKLSLDPSLAGKPLYFKFTGFNARGGMEQPLASVSPYTYTPYGLLLGQYAYNYQVTWDNPSDQLAQGSGPSIVVNPFTIASAAGAPHYLGAGAAGSIDAALTHDGGGTPLSATSLYYVYVYDPNYAGENVALGVSCTYEADLTPARATTPGWFSLGTIQMMSGGGGSGGGGGQGGSGGGGNEGGGPPYYL
jgi:prepilin-type processing-associated H-X9-DG protein